MDLKEHGRVVEIWNHRDDLGLLQQMGVERWAGAGAHERS